jgi:leucyl aminopeptidase
VNSALDVGLAGRRLPPARTAVGLFEDESPTAAERRPELRGALRELAARRGWRGREGQIAEVAGARGVTEFRGLGKASAFDARKLRAFVEAVVDTARTAGEARVVIVLPDHPAARGEAAARRVATDSALAGYRFDRYRSEKSKARLRSVLLAPAETDARTWRGALWAGGAVARGVIAARELANTPPNVATPEWMAAQARALARRHGAKVMVLGEPELRRRGMGGVLAVGGGSRNPPRMVRVELGRGPLTVALVGKGVTFDTGGISIKPAAQMDEMKWDKCGACAVLGVLQAAAELELPVRLRAYLPLAENMPDGSAYRPGDIVTCANGKTVEILNTDAEGRMILADALVWAAAERPDALIEYSTLTGACVVALGPTGAGLFSPDDELAGALLDAAESAGERLWRLPLWDEFLDEMRGSHADLKNSGGRWGGASTAAAFLSQFVAPVTRWAHLDIAGPAYVGEGKTRRGATGYGVALTLAWLAAQASGGAGGRARARKTPARAGRR